MNVLNSLFAYFPFLEYLAKTLNQSLPTSNRFKKFLSSAKAKSRRVDSFGSFNSSGKTFDHVIECLCKHGISGSDICIFHTSYSALKPFEPSPGSICLKLINLLGGEGTVVLPTFPLFKYLKRHSATNTCEVFDLLSRRCWTGDIPRAFLGIEGVVRSPNPINNLTAYGKHANEMMKCNIADEIPLPCGKNSSWEFCYKNNAWLVFLGVDAVHSMTMIHLAEDLWHDLWPVNRWYVRRDFLLNIDNIPVVKTFLERDPAWSVHYCERSFKKDLVAEGILTSFTFEGLRIELCKSKPLIDFLKNNQLPAYPYRFIRSKNLKN